MLVESLYADPVVAELHEVRRRLLEASGGDVEDFRRRGGSGATDRPVHLQEITATLYHCLGIRTSETTLIDTTGRPQYLAERLPLPELV